MTRRMVRTGVTLGLVPIAAVVWLRAPLRDEDRSLARGRGGIEGVELHVATRWAGRVEDVLVSEGQLVPKGQTLARMELGLLEAQRQEVEAQLQRARLGIETAERVVAQREAERAAGLALLAQREGERDTARQDLERDELLARERALSPATFDAARVRCLGADTGVEAARAQLAAAEAAISGARSALVGAHADVLAWQANLRRVEAELADGILRAPRDARVLRRVAEPGQVLAAGAEVLTLLDVSDVCMTFLLPTEAAARTTPGAEVRLVLDAAPGFVFPARVSFVAEVAQLAPLESEGERPELLFRVKAHIDRALLHDHLEDVRSGVTGVAHVKLDPRTEWPEHLRERLPR